MAAPDKAALAAAWATQQIGSQAWNEYCERLVENAYGTSGRYPSATAASKSLALSQDQSQAQPGDLVYFRADPSNRGFGHAGIYVGNGRMVSATPSGIKETAIFSDPYYGPRFVGFAKAPPEWQGRTSDAQLAAGAQRLLSNAASSSQLTMAPMKEAPVSQTATAADPRIKAEQEHLREATAQRDVLYAAVNAAKYNMSLKPSGAAGTPGTTANAEWVKQKQEAVDNANKAYQENEAKIREYESKIAGYQFEGQKAAATAAADKTTGRIVEQGNRVWFFPEDGSKAQDITPSGWQPDESKTQTVSVGGRVYEKPPGGSWTLAIDTRTPSDTAKERVDLQTSELRYKQALFEYEQATSEQAKQIAELKLKQAEIELAKARRPDRFQGPDGRMYTLSEDGATATPISGVGSPLKTIQTQEGRLYYSPDEGKTWTQATGLPEPEPRDVSAGPTQRYLIRRKPDGSIEQVPNPNYTTPQLADPGANYEQERTRLQSAAMAKRNQLLELQHNGTLTAQQAEQQFNDYFQNEVLSPLSGLRVAAERQRRTDLLEQQAAQRAEQQRVDAINRQREQFAFQSGEQLRADAASRVPDIRSPGFLQGVGNLAQNWLQGNFTGSGVNLGSDTYNLQPSQIPNLDQIAKEQTARALASISPAAAATIGQPIPEVAALPQIPPFQLPPPQQAQIPGGAPVPIMR